MSKRKVVHVETGTARDEVDIIRLRPIIESYIADKKDFNSTKMNWWMNKKDDTFGFKIEFFGV